MLDGVPDSVADCDTDADCEPDAVCEAVVVTESDGCSAMGWRATALRKRAPQHDIDLISLQSPVVTSKK